MRRDTVAEWILGQVMTKGRAAAIVGDLSEADAPTCAFKFWLSIMGIVFASAWTWLIALAAGIYVAAWSVVFFNELLFGQGVSCMFGNTPLADAGVMKALPLTKAGTLLLIVSPYAMVRHGLKDRVTRLMVAWLILIVVTIYSGWRPVVFSVCVATAAASIIACLWTKERRRASSVILLTAAAGFLLAPVASWLVSLVHHPAFGCELQGCVLGTPTPALGVAQVLLALPVVLVWTFLQARLLENDPPRAQSEERLYAGGTAYSSMCSMWSTSRNSPSR